MSEQTIFELIHTIEQVTYKTLVKWRQVNESNLGISHILALRELKIKGESRPSDLANTLNFTPASLTHLSAKLLDAELITRRTDEVDRRISYWNITDKGRAILVEAHRDGQALHSELFSHLSKDEQEQLLKIYSKLKNSL